jgi:hypothetical protein
MSEGAKGIYQLKMHTSSSDDSKRYETLEPLVKGLRDKIVLHNPTNSWPNDIIASLENIQSELNKPRNNNNKLTQNLQDQIKTFSDEFTKQRQQQK